jgi:hypothetical protein
MKMGAGMTEGKAPAGITLGSKTKITPELIWSYFILILNLFRGGWY